MEGAARQKFFAKIRRIAHKHREEYKARIRKASETLKGGGCDADGFFKGECNDAINKWFEDTFDPKKNGLEKAFEPGGPLDKAFDPEKNGVNEAFRKFGKDLDKAHQWVGDNMNGKGMYEMGRTLKDAGRAGFGALGALTKSPTAVFVMLMYVAEQFPAVEVAISAIEMAGKIANGEMPNADEWLHLAVNVALVCAGPAGVEKAVSNGVEKAVVGGVATGMARLGPAVSAQTARIVAKGTKVVAKKAGEYAATGAKSVISNTAPTPISKTVQRGLAMANFFGAVTVASKLDSQKDNEIRAGYAGVANTFFGRPGEQWTAYLNARAKADGFVTEVLKAQPWLKKPPRPQYTPLPNKPEAETIPPKIALWNDYEQQLNELKNEYKRILDAIDKHQGDDYKEVQDLAYEMGQYGSREGMVAYYYALNPPQKPPKESERIRIYNEKKEAYEELLSEWEEEGPRLQQEELNAKLALRDFQEGHGFLPSAILDPDQQFVVDGQGKKVVLEDPVPMGKPIQPTEQEIADWEFKNQQKNNLILGWNNQNDYLRDEFEKNQVEAWRVSTSRKFESGALNINSWLKRVDEPFFIIYGETVSRFKGANVYNYYEPDVKDVNRIKETVSNWNQRTKDLLNDNYLTSATGIGGKKAGGMTTWREIGFRNGIDMDPKPPKVLSKQTDYDPNLSRARLVCEWFQASLGWSKEESIAAFYHTTFHITKKYLNDFWKAENRYCLADFNWREKQDFKKMYGTTEQHDIERDVAVNSRESTIYSDAEKFKPAKYETESRPDGSCYQDTPDDFVGYIWPTDNRWDAANMEKERDKDGVPVMQLLYGRIEVPPPQPGEPDWDRFSMPPTPTPLKYWPKPPKAWKIEEPEVKVGGTSATTKSGMNMKETYEYVQEIEAARAKVAAEMTATIIEAVAAAAKAKSDQVDALATESDVKDAIESDPMDFEELGTHELIANEFRRGALVDTTKKYADDYDAHAKTLGETLHLWEDERFMAESRALAPLGEFNKPDCYNNICIQYDSSKLDHIQIHEDDDTIEKRTDRWIAKRTAEENWWANKLLRWTPGKAAPALANAKLLWDMAEQLLVDDEVINDINEINREASEALAREQAEAKAKKREEDFHAANEALLEEQRQFMETHNGMSPATWKKEQEKANKGRVDEIEGYRLKAVAEQQQAWDESVENRKPPRDDEGKMEFMDWWYVRTYGEGAFSMFTTADFWPTFIEQYNPTTDDFEMWRNETKNVPKKVRPKAEPVVPEQPLFAPQTIRSEPPSTDEEKESFKNWYNKATGQNYETPDVPLAYATPTDIEAWGTTLSGGGKKDCGCGRRSLCPTNLPKRSTMKVHDYMSVIGLGDMVGDESVERRVGGSKSFKDWCSEEAEEHGGAGPKMASLEASQRPGADKIRHYQKLYAKTRTVKIKPFEERPNLLGELPKVNSIGVWGGDKPRPAGAESDWYYPKDLSFEEGAESSGSQAASAVARSSGGCYNCSF